MHDHARRPRRSRGHRVNELVDLADLLGVDAADLLPGRGGDEHAQALAEEAEAAHRVEQAQQALALAQAEHEQARQKIQRFRGATWQVVTEQDTATGSTDLYRSPSE